MMPSFRGVVARIGGFVARGRQDRELNDELASHIELHIDDLVRSGVTPTEARRLALVKFGAMEAIKEDYRDRRGLPWIDALWSDVRFAVRTWRQAPAFTAAASLTLALGIGATTAIFSAVRPILFDPLPYPAQRQLITVWYSGSDGARVQQAFGTYREVAARSHTLETVAVMKPWQPALGGNREPERLEGQRVSAAYFTTLGVLPIAGRNFEPGDDVVNGPTHVIISDGLRRRLFADDDAIGRTMTLDAATFTIIGVMPASFENVLAPEAEVWAPLDNDMSLGSAWGHHLRMVARERSRANLEDVRRDLDLIARTPVADFPRVPWASLPKGFVVASLRDDVTAGVRPAFMAVLGAVVLLLVIACVNVTNLLLGRGVQRRPEFALRVALGAGRARLVRQLITESLLLASMGGAVGILVAEFATRELTLLSPASVPRVTAVGIDGGVFIVAVAVTTVVGVLVGLIPALHALRRDLNLDVRHASSRSTSGPRVARRLLVVAEVALAIVLLVGAGLLLRSLQRLFAIDPGFDATRLLTLQVQTVNRRLDLPASERLFAALQDAVSAVPGVAAAAFTSQLPLSGDKDKYGAKFEDEDPEVGDDVFRYATTSRYFETIRIPLRRGRFLDDRDTGTAPRAAVISESLARKKFANRDPIGQRVRFGPLNSEPYTIVGVVGDVKQMSLAASEPDAVYLPAAQSWFVDTTMSLVVRARGDASAVTPAVKRAIWSVDPGVPAARVATMEDLLARLAAERRYTFVVFEAFAVVALILAAIGIYGVLSSGVTERAREIGVRAALGASRSQLVALVVRQGMIMTTAGVVIGIAGAALGSRAIVTMLFRISPLDLGTYSAVVTLLAIISALACVVPAWRAARVDPMVTLRAE